jgi:hypothetical protein
MALMGCSIVPKYIPNNARYGGNGGRRANQKEANRA